MTKMSFTDKLGVLLNVINSSKEYILIFFVLLFIGYVILSTNNKKSKKMKNVFLMIYLFIIGSIIYMYHTNLSNMFDYMMNNLFIVIYFPNLAVYLAAIITTNIIMWISIFSNKTPNFIKSINVALYSMITYLLILILNVIKENKLDVFTQSSVYGNATAQALIELSSILFIIWIAFLTIYKIIKTIIVRPKEISVQQKVERQVIERKAPKPYRQIQPPYIVKANMNTIKVEKNESQKYDDLLTLDDYKLLLNILREQKEKEQREKDRQARIDKEQAKFRELQSLYIR